MASKAIGASVKKLSKLHELLVDLFIEDIEACREAGIPMSASDKGVIVTFLKNEEITAMPESEAISELKNTFAELSEARRAKAMNILNSVDNTDIPLS